MHCYEIPLAMAEVSHLPIQGARLHQRRRPELSRMTADKLLALRRHPTGELSIRRLRTSGLDQRLIALTTKSWAVTAIVLFKRELKLHALTVTACTKASWRQSSLEVSCSMQACAQISHRRSRCTKSRSACQSAAAMSFGGNPCVRQGGRCRLTLVIW